MTDIEIAKNVKLKNITEIAKNIGIKEDEIEVYGKYKAKISNEVSKRLKEKENGKLILVTAINPTPLGEGKTTVSIAIADALNKIGKNGFGKKSSTGKGSFSVSLDESFKGFEQLNTYYYMTISPTIPKENDIEEFFYNTFNRFGKYSNSGTPFKKPVLMADSAAVVKLKNSCTYIGRAINNGTNKTSFLQAYSILVPFKFNEKGLIC